MNRDYIATVGYNLMINAPADAEAEVLVDYVLGEVQQCGPQLADFVVDVEPLPNEDEI